MKITRKQLRRLIREAMPPGGVPDVLGAMGGGKFQPRDPQGAEDIVMEALEEFIDALSVGNSAVEIEALLTQLVGRAVDIAVRDKVIPERL